MDVMLSAIKCWTNSRVMYRDPYTGYRSRVHDFNASLLWQEFVAQAPDKMTTISRVNY